MSSKLTITNVEVIHLQKRLAAPTVNSKAAPSVRRYSIIKVSTDQGIYGLGEAAAPAEAVPGVVAALRSRVVGYDAFASEAIWNEVVEGSPRYDLTGLPMAVVSGIDTALWDIKGKALGVPVYELLGGRLRSRVRAYASDLHWQEDPAEMGRVAAGFVERGFRHVKTHLGRDAQDDIRRVRALREAIGPDVALMVDINTAYSLPTAITFGRRIEEFDIFWYEEPLAPHDLVGCARVRADTGLPIATGENEYTRFGFKRLFDADAADFAMPDVARTGGITELKRICALAQAYHVVVSPHNYSSGVCLAATLHVMASTVGTELLEYDPLGYAISREFFVEPPEEKDGEVSIPDTPGLGVHLTDELIERFGY